MYMSVHCSYFVQCELYAVIQNWLLALYEHLVHVYISKNKSNAKMIGKPFESSQLYSKDI